MKFVAAILGLFALNLGVPTGINNQPLDLELKQADVVNVYRLLSDVAGKKFDLDPCVHGTVDLNLKNAPVTLVMDALASKLNVAYDDDGVAIHVVCPNTRTPQVIPKVTLTETSAPLGDVLTRLATNAHLDGVDYRAKAQPTVTMTLPPVRLGTALTALTDASGITITVQKNRLVASD